MPTCKANNCYSNTNYSWENYCSYHEKCLSKLRQHKSIDNIQEIETFETWFNGNCGYVINYDSSYRIWTVVYEPKQWNKEISESLSVMKYDSSYGSLSYARDKAQEIRDKLKYSDNPILSVHPRANNNCSFSSVVTSPYVKDNQVGTCTKTDGIPLVYVNYSSLIPSDLDRHFKPLDIVWAQCVNRWFGSEFYHVGFYLGNDTIFHFSGDNNSVERTDWRGFLKSTFFNGITGKILRYHPVIPFKNYKTIIGEAVWAKDRDFRKGNYNLPNRNCEHFANMLVHGINFSQQVDERADDLRTRVGVQVGGGTAIAGGAVVLSTLAAPFTFGLSLIPGLIAGAGGVIMVGNAVESQNHFNNNKGGVCLVSEIRETNNMLGQKSDSETEQYERQYLQEVPAKDYCRIM